MTHKRFHLLEKEQFSQEKVQMCENHQIRRADFGEKNPRFFGTPPALKHTHGGARGVPLIVALVWLLHGHRPPICEFGWKLTPTHSCTPAVYFV